MKLLLDIGNTRLKACIFDGELRLLGEVGDVDALTQWLNQHGSALSVAGIASVATAEALQDIQRLLGRHLQASAVHRVRYCAELLASDYLQPERLGIDRWLALLPFLGQRQAIVIDAGTAFTLDVMRDARHVGGYILPGVRLQREALAQQTAAVNFADPDLHGLALGLTTAACVGHGSLLSLVALGRAVMAERAPSKAYITGGDAVHFIEHLRAEWRPLLVFEGMLIALNHMTGDAR